MFFNSLANQKLSTVIKAISATRQTIVLYIILASKRRMQNWFNLGLELITVFDISKSRFTNNYISVL
jgi:hypothetical protein